MIYFRLKSTRILDRKEILFYFYETNLTNVMIYSWEKEFLFMMDDYAAML